jgi:16S rRNA G966 N2-methylase RsmD
MITEINKRKYHVNDNEFKKNIIPEYNNLHVLDDVGLYERLLSLFIEIKKCNIKNLQFFFTSHGGFLPIECSNYFENIMLLNTDIEHHENIDKNLKLYNINNVNHFLIDNDYPLENYTEISESIIFTENNNLNLNYLTKNKGNILITKFNLKLITKKIYNYIFKLKNTDFFIYLNENNINSFKEIFKYYIEDEDEDGINILNYDNLIHVCILVKDAGSQFEEMLTKNLPYIDRWTILDTGSTDDTINIIKKVLIGKKQGELYQEPFINFRDSRNRCLDLAGTLCKFIIMLDDTYVVKGDLRNFLNQNRGDQRSDSFSLFINDNDVDYASNRIIKSTSKLRYKFKIHEVMDDKDNYCIMIPDKEIYISDRKFDFMYDRTINRNESDLKILFEELYENPMEPRTYYYIATTYSKMKRFDLAFDYYIKRGKFVNTGFIQERIDALFEAARLACFELNKTWEECLSLYEEAFKIDETRPDSQYFIGMYYLTNGHRKSAYKYFKKGFEIGYPIHTQYSLKPTISFHFLPKFLTSLCYEMNDYKLGELSAEFFLEKNSPDSDLYEVVLSWYNIFKKLNLCPEKKILHIPKKPLFCFIADGGYEPWTGKNILTTGVGGSETYIIEMAKYIQLSGHYDVIVFCNCIEEEIFENVSFQKLSNLYSFINSNYIHTCVVSRYSEYLPIAFKGYTENVYLVVHDLNPTGIVIPIDKKLKNIFCLTEWHVSYFNSMFPSLSHLVKPFYNGIDIEKFQPSLKKIPFKFIYSSFPNRGLLPLLQMWPKIYQKQPLATLHIYSDINGKWVNEVEPEKMILIKQLLKDFEENNNKLGIFYHGWVDKKTLSESWITSDIWLYPCTFKETFCITALECASSKTLVITNDLAGLQNTVGDRGIIIKGNPDEQEWQDKAIEKIFYYMDSLNLERKNNLINKNFEWASGLSWKNQAQKLLNEFILPNNKLEHKQNLNWTNDYPSKEESDVIYKIIYFFNNKYVKNNINKKIKILEIDTYTGTSIINFVKNINNSIGIAIDKWEDKDLEVDKSFYKNIEIEELQGKIKGIKDNSKDYLLKSIRYNEKFDFIFINPKCDSIDYYLDCTLAWHLLNNGGILGICNNSINSDDNLNGPYNGVNKFLIDIGDNCNVLHSGYTFFIERNNKIQ